MKKLSNIILYIIIISISLAGCQRNGENISSENNENQSIDSTIEYFTNRDFEIGYDEESATNISLNDNEIQIHGSGASTSDNVITISQEGTYILKGELSDGQIIIDANKEHKVQLVLDSVSIENSSSAPIYVKQANKVFITMPENAENTLSVTGDFLNIDDNNIDGVIFSKDDLTLNGNGSLTISTQYGNGITSKDDLVITSGNYNISATGHALEGKDSVRIANGEFEIASGKDGIHSENNDDTELGLVYILDGIFNISSSDDGIYAASNVTINGGNINIRKSYEGIEGQSIDIINGEVHIVSSDDGLNSAGGKDQSGIENRGGKGMFSIDENAYINISGGIININAQGDGIDSNGDLIVTGGKIYVDGPTNNGNGALDYNGKANISGGTLVAVGTSGMAQNFGHDSTQGSILVTSDNIENGEVILKDEEGNAIFSFIPEKEYNSVVISVDELEIGKKYTIIMGDYSQTVEMTSLIYGEGGVDGMRDMKPKDNHQFPNNREGQGSQVPDSGKGPEFPNGKKPEPSGEIPFKNE